MRAEGVSHGTRSGFFLLPALLPAVLLCCGCRRPAALSDALVLTASDGSRLELKGGEGATVLVFVSRLSPPSLSLLDELKRTAVAQGVRFLAVTEDRDAGLPDRLPAGFEVTRDPDRSAAARFHVNVLPAVVVLDRQLKVAFRENGFGLRTAGRLAGALAAGDKQP